MKLYSRPPIAEMPDTAWAFLPATGYFVRRRQRPGETMDALNWRCKEQVLQNARHFGPLFDDECLSMDWPPAWVQEAWAFV